MNRDQESLLSNPSRAQPFEGLITRNYANSNGASRLRKNLIVLMLFLFIALCLAVYFYLNIVAIDSNQQDPSRFKPLSRRKPMLDHESIFSGSGPSMIKLSDLLAHCVVALHIAGKEVVNLSLVHNKKLNHVGSKGKTLEGANDVVTDVDMKSHQMILNTIKDSYRRLSVVSEEDSTTAFENTKPEDDILPVERTEFARQLRANLMEIEGPHVDRNSLIAQHETLVWIDPLDATKEYSENLTSYVTLMACIVYKSQPIAGVIYKPFTNETYWSMKDVSTGKYYYSQYLKDIILDSQEHLGKSPLKIIVSRSHAGDVKNLIKEEYGDRAEIISAAGSGYKTIELLKGKADAYMHMTRIKKWDICGPHAILNSIQGGNMTDLDGNLLEFGEAKDKVVTRGILATFNKTLHSELIDSARKFRVNRNDM